MTKYKPARLLATASQRSFEPTISNTPGLPIINWSQVGQQAPKLVDTASKALRDG